MNMNLNIFWLPKMGEYEYEYDNYDWYLWLKMQIRILSNWKLENRYVNGYKI